MTNRLDQIACRLLGIAYIEFVDIEPDPDGDEWPEVLVTLPDGKQISYPHNGDLHDRVCMANVAHEDVLAQPSVEEVRWIIARSRE